MEKIKNFLTRHNLLHIVISMMVSLIAGFILINFKNLGSTIVLSGAITFMFAVWFQAFDSYKQKGKATVVALQELLSDLIGIGLSFILMTLIF